MRTTCKRGNRARLSFSGGPHAPVNMAESMENAGSWTVSGSKEAMEVPKKFKDLRKLRVRNIAQDSGANVPFLAGFFPLTFTSSILSAMFTGECGPPEKLSLDLVHDCETHLYIQRRLRLFLKTRSRRRACSSSSLMYWSDLSWHKTAVVASG